jgi:predicted secreted protein
LIGGAVWRIDRGMVRTLIACLLATALALAPGARAGDVAQVEIIGFSADGAYVAFEQYGEQDGSGFPYADVFVIDVAADDWVDGTPVRVLLQDDSAGPEAARKAARGKAAEAMARVGIEPGRTGRALLRHPMTDRSVDPHAARFAIFAFTDREYELQLVERTVSAPDCPEDFAPFKLFDLVLVEPEGAERYLHQDAALPKSRGCPLDYAIAEVWVHGFDAITPAGTQTLLVLLHMQQPGFEGPDVRFLAVGLRPAGLRAF